MSFREGSFTLRIFVPGGDLAGLRLVEKSNWNGRGLVCPRSTFPKAKGRLEFNRTGVYVLTGPEEDGGQLKVYVGEGDPNRPRLEQHYAKKDFWTTLFLFTSKDEYLNKAHIQFLESRLISTAAEAKRCELDNGNRPALPSMSETDVAEAEGFLKEILICFPVLGLDVFEKPTTRHVSRQILILKGKGIEAKGYESPDGFVVLANSQAVRDAVPSIHRFMLDMRDSLAKRGVFQQDSGAYRLTQNYVFDSPSTAAGVLLGRSANGRLEWKDGQGCSLREIQEQRAAQTEETAGHPTPDAHDS